MSHTLLLAGGVGGARMLRGLAGALSPDRLQVIVNTADDETFHGLHISPDVDTLLYTLARVVDRAQGWGIAGDSFQAMDMLAKYGVPTWFRLGDADLGTHLFRSAELARGRSLTRITQAQARGLGVKVRVRPMSDDPVRTIIETDRGRLNFQEYLVRERARGRVRAVRFRGIRSAKPAPGVLGTIARARRIVIGPSNPFVSIGPILSLPGVRAAVRRARAPVVAVSPLIGGRPVKGPADRMMRGLGFRSNPLGLADVYADLVDAMVVDERDAGFCARLVKRGVRVRSLPILMNTEARARAVADATLALADEVGTRRSAEGTN